MNGFYIPMPTSGHMLYLYAGDWKLAIHSRFLSALSRKERVLYISEESPEKIKNALGRKGIEVVRPEHMKDVKGFEKVIVDAASIAPKKMEHKKIGVPSPFHHTGRERLLEDMNLAGCILCTYDMSRLDTEEMQSLIDCHDKIIYVNAPHSQSSPEKPSEKSVRRFVRKDIDVLVMALLANKPLCGSGIKRELHKNFNVRLSSGTLYPLLHRLRKDGLLECKAGFKKEKTYMHADPEKVREMLSDYISANKFFDSFLQSAVNGDKKWENMSIA